MRDPLLHAVGFENAEHQIVNGIEIGLVDTIDFADEPASIDDNSAFDKPW
ncbi:MAG: hypothetical protein WDN50_09920 [Bradyrhizobium sp.]